jgi:hypothetical protein
MEQSGLQLPDGSTVECHPVPADDQFANIFRTSCRNPPTADEIHTIDNYIANIIINCPAGSMELARRVMDAGAAIIHAGGAGVFIDNSGISHGGASWIELADDGGPDALSFAFVGIVAGKTEAWSMGMNVVGLPDVVMQRSDIEPDHGDELIEMIRYMFAGDKPVNDGHIIADLDGPRYKVLKAPADEFDRDSVMHNPAGRFKLVNMTDFAERN